MFTALLFFCMVFQDNLKANLDLPYTAEGEDEEEEDAPEVILFFGRAYEGDSFVLVLDISGSMRGRKIATLKREAIQTVSEMSIRTKFSIVAFHSQNFVFSERTVLATPQEKKKAIAFINSLEVGGSTQLCAATLKALEISKTSETKRRQIIVECDGIPDDPEVTLKTIKTANADNKINSVYIYGTATQRGRDFMKRLASENRGDYNEVSL